jgi:hypothetical protein
MIVILLSAANTTLKYQKGQTTSEYAKDNFTFSLLLAVMAMQDSSRLLVTLALVDGVFGPGIT